METLRIHLKGKSIRKDNLRIPELINILENIQKVVGVCSGLSYNKKEWNKYALSIKSIKDGSAILELAPAEDQEEIDKEKTKEGFKVLNKALNDISNDRYDEFVDTFVKKEIIHGVVSPLIDITNTGLDIDISIDEYNYVLENKKVKSFKKEIDKKLDEPLKLDIIAQISEKNIKKDTIELWTGDPHLIIKISSDYYSIFEKFFESPVRVKGNFKKHTTKNELYLKSLDDFKILKKEFSTDNIFYKNLILKFKEPIRFIIEKNEYNYYEIHSPFFDTFTFGEKFAEAWYDMCEYIYEIYDIAKNSDLEISDSFKEVKVFFEECVVNSFGI